MTKKWEEMEWSERVKMCKDCTPVQLINDGKATLGLTLEKMIDDLGQDHPACKELQEIIYNLVKLLRYEEIVCRGRDL